MSKEIIIQENTEKHGWCLFRVCNMTMEQAEKRLNELKSEYPDKELRIETIDEKQAWWKDPFLAN